MIRNVKPPPTGQGFPARCFLLHCAPRARLLGGACGAHSGQGFGGETISIALRLRLRAYPAKSFRLEKQKHILPVKHVLGRLGTKGKLRDLFSIFAEHGQRIKRGQGIFFPCLPEDSIRFFALLLTYQGFENWKMRAAIFSEGDSPLAVIAASNAAVTPSIVSSSFIMPICA